MNSTESNRHDKSWSTIVVAWTFGSQCSEGQGGRRSQGSVSALGRHRQGRAGSTTLQVSIGRERSREAMKKPTSLLPLNSFAEYHLLHSYVALQDAPEVHREITTLNTDNETIRERIEADMDFKIPGIPHSIVKLAQSASVRELIQKNENHPDRHALQQDLRQNQSFNPFSPES